MMEAAALVTVDWDCGERRVAQEKTVERNGFERFALGLV